MRGTTGSDGSTSGGCCLALNSYFTSRIFQPSSLHMQLTSSEARMQRLKYPNGQDSFDVPGSYYAHHAEVKERIYQFDQGTNAMTGVTKPMCPECRAWHQRVAVRQNQTFVVVDPIYIRHFNSDGSVDVFYNTGFGEPSRVGHRAARIEPGAPPSRNRYSDGSPW
jgi:hypothetical protein